MQCPVIRVTPILFVPVVCVTPLVYVTSPKSPQICLIEQVALC